MTMVALATDNLIQERFRTDDACFSESELEAALEALLIVANEPPSPAQLAESVGIDQHEIDAALSRMEMQSHRGWILQRHGETIRLTTAPRFADSVRRFLGIERQAKLSSAALETLAIIAYRQPITRNEVETVRGVDCTGVLATLLQRNLIETTGRLDTVGNPNVYATTAEFLMHFGLKSLADLPALGTINGLDAEDQLTGLIAETEYADERQDATAV